MPSASCPVPSCVQPPNRSHAAPSFSNLRRSSFTPLPSGSFARLAKKSPAPSCQTSTSSLAASLLSRSRTAKTAPGLISTALLSPSPRNAPISSLVSSFHTPARPRSITVTPVSTLPAASPTTSTRSGRFPAISKTPAMAAPVAKHAPSIAIITVIARTRISNDSHRHQTRSATSKPLYSTNRQSIPPHPNRPPRSHP